MKGKQKKSVLNSSIEALMEKGEELTKNTEKSENSVIYALSCYPAEELRDIAKKHELKGYSKLKKKDLLNAVVGCVLDEETAKEYFMNAKDDEYALYDALYQKKKPEGQFSYEQFLYWIEGGYLFAKEGENSFIICDETRELYEKINTDIFQQKRGEFCKVAAYLSACRNLYGIIPISKFLEIYNEQNEEKLDKDLFLESFQILSEQDDSMVLREDTLIEKSLIECNEYDILMEQQKDKPFYVPEQKEFLRYADDDYMEHNVQFETLKRYLIRTKKVEEASAQHLCMVIQVELSLGVAFGDVVKHFEEEGIQWSGDKQFNEMLEILRKCANNTRMITNRGYTPNEIAVLSHSAMKRNTLQGGRKIYPNSPCPCGSGKKYKYCCGK